MKLYFDVGNTNIKIHLVSKNSNEYFFLETNKACTINLFYNKMPKQIKQLPIKSIFICSVVPLLTIVVKAIAKKYYQIEPIIINRFLKTGVKLKIEKPSSVGEDLLMLAAYANTRSNNTIVVNLGTATTIIHVQNKALLGVIIMPGIILQLEALLKKTAKINNIKISYSKLLIAKNTKDALSIGIISSHIYAIKNHLKTIDPTAKVIISGGNAQYVLEQLHYEYVKEATIEGIKVVEQLNDK